MPEVTGKCEKCGATFDFDSSFIGQVADCPSCNKDTILKAFASGGESEIAYADLEHRLDSLDRG